MKVNNEEFFIKFKDEQEQKEKQPLTFFSMNNIIFEDNPNKTIKIYDKTLFDNMNVLKLEKVENVELNKESQFEEKIKNLEKEKSQFDTYISKMKNLISEIEANTNQIKLEMETDKKKKEELKKKEEERLKKERQLKLEEERKKREMERLRKEKEEQERIKRQQELQNKQKNEIADIFNNSGRNVKERLINAGKNFENVKKEIKKIVDNQNLSNLTRKIIIAINDTITNKTTTIKNLDKSIKELDKLLKEIKQKNNEELYLYACFNILVFIFKKIDEVESGIDYESIFIISKIIFSLNCKTLTYLFFQRISNKCPYIIPLPYIKEEYDRLFKDNDLNEVFRLCRNAEYIYFTFLYLDINKYIDIIENYISNLEQFNFESINFLISNSFYCFIDVFGNYILKNKRNWINKILKIKDNVMKGLGEEAKKVANTESQLVSINKSIKLKIENCFITLNNNGNTKFMENFFKLNRI